MAPVLPPPSYYPESMPAATSWHSSAPLPGRNPIRLPHPPPPPPQTYTSHLDEFLEFSTLRRGSHRRSASDSVKFLEAAAEQHGGGGGSWFERLDDEQLMSMFSDGLPGPSSSTPNSSGQNSNDNEEKAEEGMQPPEVESSAEPAGSASPPDAGNRDLVTDPKRVKRILANRQSAQKSRVRKLQYTSELEQCVMSLQMEVSALSPRVAFLDHQRLILNCDNSALKQRIAAFAQDKMFKDAHQEALKKEIERLRQVYHNQQSLENMRGATADLGRISLSGTPQEPDDERD